ENRSFREKRNDRTACARRQLFLCDRDRAGSFAARTLEPAFAPAKVERAVASGGRAAATNARRIDVSARALPNCASQSLNRISRRVQANRLSYPQISTSLQTNFNLGLL